MPKELRAGLYERFADWLEARPSAFPVIIDELLGYHVERAVRLRRELGETDEATATLASRASAHLGAAGLRAAQRDDPAAASTLFERATTLVGPDDAGRGALLPAFGASLFEAGRIPEAVAILDEAIERAPEARLEARARIEREFVRLESEASAATAHARRTVDKALPVLEREGDDAGQCRAWYLQAQALWIAGRAGEADSAWGEGAACARRAGDDRELFRILGMRATASVLGPIPVEDAIQRCREYRDLVGASPVAAVLMLNPLASLHAMQGEFELADGLLSEANETLDQLGSMGWVSHHEALVRMLEGRPALAEVPLRAGVEKLASMSDRGLLATTLAMLAQAVYAQGQLAEAEQLSLMAADAGAAEDLVTQVISRGVEAEVLARSGRPMEAESLAREAVALVAPTDLLSITRCDARPRRGAGNALSGRRVSERCASRSFTLREEGQCHRCCAGSLPARPSDPGDLMPFSGNFTRISLGDNPDGGTAMLVEGRTNDTAEPPKAIHVMVPHNGVPLTATVENPTLTDWEVMFRTAIRLAEGERCARLLGPVGLAVRRCE